MLRPRTPCLRSALVGSTQVTRGTLASRALDYHRSPVLGQEVNKGCGRNNEGILGRVPWVTGPTTLVKAPEGLVVQDEGRVAVVVPAPCPPRQGLPLRLYTHGDSGERVWTGPHVGGDSGVLRSAETSSSDPHVTEPPNLPNPGGREQGHSDRNDRGQGPWK